jgi:histidyl-tRNA synthetase
MRPEGTAPAMRAFIEHGLHNQAAVHKLFYMGPMFRYERSQAGRYRQHHQLGAEAIGVASPEQDAEVIDFLYTLYQRLGLQNLQVNINCIGSVECRIAYRTALQEYLRSHLNELSPESQARFETNPLRILDSKDEKDNKITVSAPSILDFLSQEAKEHFEVVKRLLNQLNIPFNVNPKLVRGLDYYNKTVFEVTSGELGAQNSVGGGGRYDGLLKTLGGPDLPAVGFGTGLERIIQAMIKQNVPIPTPPKPLPKRSALIFYISCVQVAFL